jgi:DNA invertase Pin-like site-specific DNA recombinase
VNVRHLRPGDLKGLRWRGYIRESTEEQTDRGTPPARQKADILRAVEELGMVGEPFWYERSGSGEKVSAELQRALNDAGQYDVLVVFSTSRFARNRAEAVRMKAAFSQAGLIVYFAADRMISGARTSSLTEGIKEVVDAEENETRRFFIAGGLRERQLAGKWVGAPPYGYRRHMEDRPDGSRGWSGDLEPDPAEAEVVRRIFAMAVSRTPISEISRTLNSEGLMGRTAPWVVTTLSGLIANPIYRGQVIRYRRKDPGHYYPEADPRDGRQILEASGWALVHEDVWTAAQIGQHRRMGTKHPYPLSGVIRCGKCGAKMTGCHNGNSIRYYRCSAHALARSTCEEKMIRADEAEGSFGNWLSDIKIPADWREAMAATDDLPRDDRSDKLNAYLKRIKTLYSAGDMEWDEYVAERDKTRERLAENVPTDVASLEGVAAALSQLGPLWTTSPNSALPPLIAERMIARDGLLAEIEVRASLKPLLDLCVVRHSGVYSRSRRYTLRVRYV